VRRQRTVTTLMDPSDGVAERTGRALGRAVLRGRVIARQMSDPAVQERLLATGRSAAARHGPDVVEQAAPRVTDRAFWGIAARVGFLGAALHEVRPATRQAVGRLARGIAEGVRRVEDR
jgi:hypothetical protein